MTPWTRRSKPSDSDKPPSIEIEFERAVNISYGGRRELPGDELDAFDID